MPYSDRTVAPPETEARLQLLESVAGCVRDAVLIMEAGPVDEPGPRIIYVNEAFTLMTGFNAEEVIGKDTRMLQGPETDQEAAARIRAAFQREEPLQQRVVSYRKDGSSFRVDVSFVPLTDVAGQVTHWAAIQHEPDDATERQRAAEALRQANETLQAIVQAAPLAVVALDPDTNVKIWNPAAERIFGWTEEEVLGLPYPAVPKDRSRELEDEFAAGLQGKPLVGFATERLRKDGSLVPVSISTAQLRGPDGEVQGIMGLLEDVTERRRAEDAKSRLTAILEATPDFVGTADPDGQLIYLNRAGREMLGVAEEDVQSLTVAAVHPPWATSLILEEGFPAAFRDGSWSAETAILIHDGREVPVSQVILAHKDDDGEVEYLSTIIRDISDRKRSEETQRFLAEASQTLATSIEYGPTLENLGDVAIPTLADMCVVTLVEDEKIDQVMAAARNPARHDSVERLHGVSPPREAVASMERVIRTGDPELVTEVRDAWLRDSTMDEERPQTSLDLNPRSVMIVPMRAHDKVLGALLFATSDSGRRYSRDDLAVAEGFAGIAGLAIENARLYRESLRSSRLRDEVLRVVAHDLRNPLNTIGLSAGLLSDLDAADQGELTRQVEIIQRTVDQANRLIGDLLDVARMEAGRLAVDQAPESAVQLTQECFESHLSLARKRRLRLDREVPEKLPSVLADRHRVLQVLGNLMENAIKFTPEGGRIVLRAEAGTDEVIFSVSDTGPGITDEDKAHLFDSFWQAAEHRKGGAGLGLAISRGIIEAHGGRIWVDTTVGKGTTFHFSLPVAQS